MERKLGVGYVCINDNLRHILDDGEMSFVVKLKHLDYMRKSGYRTAYSKDYYFKSFRIAKTPFYRIVRRLEALGILDRKKVGKYTDYVLNQAGYERLLKVAASTYNIEVLRAFAFEEFVVNKRSVDQITDDEISQLSIQGKVY